MAIEREHGEEPRSGHPIEAFLDDVLAHTKGLADVPTWSMDEATTARVVVKAAQASAGLAELETRVIGQAETLDLPGAAQCRSTASWLQNTAAVTHRAAAAKVKLAVALRPHEPTRAACARGEVHAEQAAAVGKHLNDLDTEKVSVVDRDRAEEFLLDEARAGRDADQLATLGHAIWERLDPDGADAREAKLLEDQEERARKKTRLTMSDDGEGSTTGRFTLPTAIAEMFRKQLHAFAAPKRVRATKGAGTYDWKTPSPERTGQAFVEWIENYDPSQVPKIGGLNATVIVVGDYDVLTGKLKAATLDTGAKISPTEYLRMACDAGIIPAWMDASGEVLAMGRKHRFHTTTPAARRDHRSAALPTRLRLHRARLPVPPPPRPPLVRGRRDRSHHHQGPLPLPPRRRARPTKVRGRRDRPLPSVGGPASLTEPRPYQVRPHASGRYRSHRAPAPARAPVGSRAPQVDLRKEDVDLEHVLRSPGLAGASALRRRTAPGSRGGARPSGR